MADQNNNQSQLQNNLGDENMGTDSDTDSILSKNNRSLLAVLLWGLTTVLLQYSVFNTWGVIGLVIGIAVLLVPLYLILNYHSKVIIQNAQETIADSWQQFEDRKVSMNKQLAQLRHSADNFPKIIGGLLSHNKEFAARIKTVKKYVEDQEIILGNIQSVQGRSSSLQHKISSEWLTEQQFLIELNSLSSNIKRNINEMSTCSIQIDEFVQEHNSFVGDVIDNVEIISKESDKTYSAVNDILQSIKKVDNDISGFVDYTNETIELVKTGRNLFLQTAEHIHQIKQGLAGSAEIIKTLNQKSIEIGEIVNVIENISDKTKLLALNAKIMAAQAGVHGRGFSVVADEMTNLSENTIRSTKNIEALIKSLQREAKIILGALQEDIKRVNSGVSYSDKASDALTDIYRASINSKKMTKKIKQSIIEQSKEGDKVKDNAGKVTTIVSKAKQLIKEGFNKEDSIFGVLNSTNKVVKKLSTSTTRQTEICKTYKGVIDNLDNCFSEINNISLADGTNVYSAIKELEKKGEEISDSIDSLKEKIN